MVDEREKRKGKKKAKEKNSNNKPDEKGKISKVRGSHMDTADRQTETRLEMVHLCRSPSHHIFFPQTRSCVFRSLKTS